MNLAMIGLGKMGANMTERLRRGGHRVVGYDAFATDRSDVATLAEAVDGLSPMGRRVAWAMVPSGAPTDDVITQLSDVMATGDLVIDGGNSNWRDSVRRGELLAAAGIGFVDCGTSGGVWGLENGYCLMVGGTPEDIACARPLFDTLAPPNGFAHVGPVGAGHFTKMVHNGVEYGMMQAFAEGVELLGASELGIDVVGALGSWREGSVVRSWLLDLLVDAMAANPGFDGIAPVAPDSGEGRWTVDEAVRLGVPAPVLAASLFARFTSQRESTAMKVVSMLRHQFGGHAIVSDGAATTTASGTAATVASETSSDGDEPS